MSAPKVTQLLQLVVVACFYQDLAAGNISSMILQVSETQYTFKTSLSFNYQNFYKCLCQDYSRTRTCTALFSNLTVSVMIGNSYWKRCFRVQKKNQISNVEINCVVRKPECSVVSSGTYIHLTSSNLLCASVCAAVFIGQVPDLASKYRDSPVWESSGMCRTPCCTKILQSDPEKSTLKTTEKVTDKMTDRVKYIVTTTSVSSEPLAITSPDTAGSHVHSDDTDKHTVVIAVSVITVTLAVIAIIISTVACWKHRTRSKSSHPGAELLGLSQGRLSQAAGDSHPWNVYSDLSRRDAGSIHRYAGLTPEFRENEAANVNSEACASEPDAPYETYGNEECVVNPIYDDVNDNERGYLEITG